jgi:hypothetical protein
MGSMAPDSDAKWSLHHSREGTIDSFAFTRCGTMKFRQTPMLSDRSAFGGPMNPLYSFGPGTLTQYVSSYKGTVRAFASLEGIIS